MRHLRDFDLNARMNYFSEEGLMSIEGSLEKSARMDCFNIQLSCCEITDDGFISLIKTIFHPKHLSKIGLHLWGNEITAKSVMFLAEALHESDQVEELCLTLGSNGISETGLTKLLKTCSNRQNLSKLSLDFRYTNLTDGILQNVEEFSKNSTKLTEVDFCFGET